MDICLKSCLKTPFRRFRTKGYYYMNDKNNDNRIDPASGGEDLSSLISSAIENKKSRDQGAKTGSPQAAPEKTQRTAPEAQTSPGCGAKKTAPGHKGQTRKARPETGAGSEKRTGSEKRPETCKTGSGWTGKKRRKQVQAQTGTETACKARAEKSLPGSCGSRNREHGGKGREEG